MKRILIIALVGVMAFSAVALGGWKFGAEQEIDTVLNKYTLSTYIGWDFYAPFINTGPVSIGGDFVVSRTYDWASVLSGVLVFDGELVFSYIDDVDVVFGTVAEVDYAPLPDSIKLNTLSFGVDVIGYVNDVLTLSTGIDFVYVNPAGTATDVFNTSFYVGFDAEW